MAWAAEPRGLCGREPRSVASGEVIVAAESPLAGGDGGEPDAEVLGDCGQGDSFGFPGWSQVVPLGAPSRAG